jgi:uncharacterized protein YbaR (Trm112 family)
MTNVRSRRPTPSLFANLSGEQAGTLPASSHVMDWSLVDVDRLAKLACPSCQRGLAGGLMRQVEWTTRRCIVVIACPNCNSESMVVLETSGTRRAAPPIDVDDVRLAHDALARAGRVSDLFPN